MPLSRAAQKTLVEMAALEDDENGELVCEGRTCYLGYRRVGRAVADDLLRCAAIKTDQTSENVYRYIIIETGKAIVRRPELADEVVRAVFAGKPFDIVNDRIKLLSAGDTQKKDGE